MRGDLHAVPSEIPLPEPLVEERWQEIVAYVERVAVRRGVRDDLIDICREAVRLRAEVERLEAENAQLKRKLFEDKVAEQLHEPRE